jgi:hypothetical protein
VPSTVTSNTPPDEGIGRVSTSGKASFSSATSLVALGS